MDLLDSLPRIEDTVLRSKIAKALSVLGRSLALYPVESISLSFNGGKDSTVLLHLLRAALAGAAKGEADGVDGPAQAGHGLHGIRTFFFDNTKDFQEVIDFVHHQDAQYGLHVDYIANPDFKAGLVEYLSAHSIKAIVLGTRRGDPNAGDQEYFCPSSEGWPPFMRVNPIIDWTYHDVWTFLKHIGGQGLRSVGLLRHLLGRLAQHPSPSQASRPDAAAAKPPPLLLPLLPQASSGAACTTRATPRWAAGSTRCPTGGRERCWLLSALPLCSYSAPAAPAARAAAPTTLPTSPRRSALLMTDGSYAPAHMLVDGRLERAGRQTSPARAASGEVEEPSGLARAPSLLSATAAIIIIGDEIVSGKVADANTSFLCKELHRLGWAVRKVRSSCPRLCRCRRTAGLAAPPVL
jgi:FAD synthetase